LRALNEKVCQK